MILPVRLVPAYPAAVVASMGISSSSVAHFAQPVNLPGVAFSRQHGGMPTAIQQPEWRKLLAA